ncbi:MAG: organic solvent ABC transporter [Alphaproteobacteria bacterium]|nr:organic solvent ABC transporter [Alphaproteobacteria bacterium]
MFLAKKSKLVDTRLRGHDYKVILVILLSLLVIPAMAQARIQDVAMRAPEPAKAGAASDVISSFYRTLTSVMKEGDTLGFQGRAQKLDAAVSKAFSAGDMTRVSYGPSWVKASPEQKDKLTRAFHNFTVANYASQFKKFDGEEFKVTGEKPGPNANQRIVETSLKSGSETHQLNYLMVKNAKGWQIADVFVDGAISEMATRRSEFGSVIRTSGADGLLTILEQKSKQMGE